jgi:hypothetical protein
VGTKQGEFASYKAPNGRVLQVEIVDAKPFVG